MRSIPFASITTLESYGRYVIREVYEIAYLFTRLLIFSLCTLQ